MALQEEYTPGAWTYTGLTHDYRGRDGIPRPNTFDTPDDVTDRIMAHVSGAEFKVLMFIVRHTFGFGKTTDKISLSQICGGIRTRTGRVLDEGTGLSRAGAVKALDGLVAKKVIVKKLNSDERGQDANTYHLRLEKEASTSAFGGDEDTPDVTAPATELPTPALEASEMVHVVDGPPGNTVDPQKTAFQSTSNRRMDTIAASSSDLWPAVLRDLEQTMTPANYERWYAPSHLLTATGGVLIIAVPDTLRRDYLESKGQAAVTRSLRRLGADGRAVRYVVASQG